MYDHAGNPLPLHLHREALVLSLSVPSASEVGVDGVIGYEANIYIIFSVWREICTLRNEKLHLAENLTPYITLNSNVTLSRYEARPTNEVIDLSKKGHYRPSHFFREVVASNASSTSISPASSLSPPSSFSAPSASSSASASSSSLVDNNNSAKAAGTKTPAKTGKEHRCTPFKLPDEDGGAAGGAAGMPTGGRLTLEKDRFYILRTKECVSIPLTLSGEMVPFSHHVRRRTSL